MGRALAAARTRLDVSHEAPAWGVRGGERVDVLAEFGEPAVGDADHEHGVVVVIGSRGRDLAADEFDGRLVTERLGISRARVSVLAGRSDFPRPVKRGRLGRSDVWRWSAVERWARQTGRLQPAE